MTTEKKKRILLLCPYPIGVAPGQRLKYEQYFDYLEQNGYDIVVSPFVTPKFWEIIYRPNHVLAKVGWTLWGYMRRLFDMFRLPFYDGAYVFLWAVPFGPPWMEWLTCHLNSRIVYDIDDLIFLTPKSKANPFVAFFKSRQNSIYMMQHAQHVITCTPYLDQFVRQYQPHTTDISSTINTQSYRPRQIYSFQNPPKLTLGWSGSHSTSAYLNLLRPVLLRLKQHLDFRLLVMGDETFTMEGIEVEALPWREEHEVAIISQFDIGLYPLPNEEWVLGKSGLKALQYMALGIPTIATAIGANFRVIEHGKSGFLVNNEQEWLDNLLQLAESEQLRRQIGQAAAQRVEKYYSIRANQPTYLSVWDSVYKK